MPLSEINEAEANKTMRDAEARMAEITSSYFSEKSGADVTGPPEVTGEEETETPPVVETTPSATETTEEETPPVVETETTKTEEEEKPAETKEAVTEPVAGAATTTVDDDDLDPEEEKAIDSISLGKNAHPKSVKALKFLQKKAKEAMRAEKKARRELKSAEEARAGAKTLDEPTEKELTELREFRRRIEIEHDPVIRGKYDSALTDLQGRALTILKSSGLPNSTAEYIQKNGGALKFRTSSNYMPENLVDSQGRSLGKITHHEFYTKFIEPELSLENREAVMALGIRATDLTLQRDQEISQAKEKSADFFKGRDEQMKKGREEWIGKVRAGSLKQVAELGVKLLEIPASATKEQKEKIDKLNAEYKQAEGIAQRVLQAADPEEMGKMAVVYAYHQTKFKREMAEKDQSLEAMRKRAEEAEKKLNAIKNASKMPHSSAPVEAPTKAKTTEQIKDPGERMAAMMATKK